MTRIENPWQSVENCIECVLMLRSLKRKQDESTNDYVLRIEFFISTLNQLNSHDPNSLTMILFLNGLPLNDEEVKKNSIDLIKELISCQNSVHQGSCGVFEEETEVKAEEIHPEAVPKPSNDEGTSIKIEDELGTEESRLLTSRGAKRKRHSLECESKLDAGLQKVAVKKSKNDIDWDKPLVYQIIKDEDCSEEAVVVCALCVKNRKEVSLLEKEFLDHAKNEHGGHLCVCDQCPFSCTTYSEIASHRFIEHKSPTDGFPKRICPKEGCDYEYVTISDVNAHDKSTHAGSTKISQRKKPKKEVGVKKLNCLNDINWDKPIVYQLIQDLDYSDEVVAVCALCVKVGKKEIIPSKKEFYQHVRDKHKGNLAVCDSCSYSSRFFVKVVSHRFYKHHTLTDGYPAKPCPREGCKYQYCVTGDITFHLNYHHDRDVWIKPATCHICGKWLRNSHSLNNHVRLAHEGFRHECDECEKKFTTSRALRQHKDREHRGLGHLHEVVCEQCGQKFPRKALREHVIRKHMRQRNHHCKLCEKAFFSKVELQNHERGVHQTSNKFQCSYCHRGMANKNALRIHTKLHLKKKEYHCRICNSWYTATHTLALHITTKHMGLPKDEASKRENISAARNHPAYEKIEDPLDLIAGKDNSSN